MMTDEKSRSALSEKALAQKVEREARERKAAEAKQAHTERLQSVDGHWSQLSGDLEEVVRSINAELADTGTSLSVKWGVPDEEKPNKLGDVTVTVMREGERLNFQTVSLEAFRFVPSKLTRALSRPEKKTDDFELQNVDRGWIDAILRDFVNRALD
jgi:hypothetical protein